MVSIMEKRQNNNDNFDNNDDGGDWWWYSSTALAIKWCIVVAIFLIFIIWFVGGYWHAQRRMKKGLAPLAYHRWLLPRRQRARFDPSLQNEYQYRAAQDGYAMHGWAPPPPAYNAEMAPPPTYQPPVGASKVNPSQNAYTVPPPVGEPSQGSPTPPSNVHHP